MNLDKSIDKSLDLADLNITGNSRISKYSYDKQRQSRNKAHVTSTTQELQDDSALFQKFLQGSEGFASQSRARFKGSSWMQNAARNSKN